RGGLPRAGHHALGRGVGRERRVRERRVLRGHRAGAARGLRPAGPHRLRRTTAGRCPSPGSGRRAAPLASPGAMTFSDPAAAPMDLVLEGGGVKGIALAGALEVLEERGYRVNRVAGSSAGSIAGALATSGIPAAQMVEILRETDYRRFDAGPWWTRTLPGKALSILLHNGVHRGTYLHQWLEEQLSLHAGPEHTGTFADLRYTEPDTALEGARGYRLVVTV